MFYTELSDALDCLRYFLSWHDQDNAKEIGKLKYLKYSERGYKRRMGKREKEL